MRVVMTTAERQAPCTKLSGVACDASHTSSSTSSTVAAPAASLSASWATRSSAWAASGSGRPTSWMCSVCCSAGMSGSWPTLTQQILSKA